MPNRDGIEVAKVYNFSHFDRDDRIPLIMMTADSRLEAREEARASGIDAFVTKPITPRQLVEVIDSVATKLQRDPRAEVRWCQLMVRRWFQIWPDEPLQPVSSRKPAGLLHPVGARSASR